MIGYLTRKEQPITYFMADNFVVCDSWFSAVPAQTMPNRFFAIGGQSAGHRDNPGITDLFLKMPTIFDKLPADDWCVYSDNPTSLHMFHSFLYMVKAQRKQRSLSRFLKDAAGGHLPKLSWISPRFSWTDSWWGDVVLPGEANDDHPPSDVALGQQLLRRIYQAVSEGPKWQRTLLVVTYDEHGGFFDHVAPPKLDESEIQSDEFPTRGLRVPTLLVSPLTQTDGPGRVFSETMDHCSLLKLVCEWQGIDPFTPRISSGAIKSVLDAIPDGVTLADPPVAPPAPPSFAPKDAIPRSLDDNDRLATDLAKRMREEFGDDLSVFEPVD